MLVIQLVGSVAALALDHLLQTRYGVLAVLGITLIGVGAQARSHRCAGAGAALLALSVMASQN